MENQNINSNKIEKEIIINDIANINKLISSSNEDTQNYLLFNESLFVNHNKWLDHVKSQLLQSLNSSNININILDMNYDDDILNLLKKISTPNNYRKNMNNMSNISSNNSSGKKDILEKIEKLTDFNDIISTLNSTCSKYKRESLIARINNNNNNSNNENINNESREINMSNDNNRITFNENNNNSNNNNNLVDEDIIIDDIITSTQKVKLEENQEFNQNSLCTIVEQPSIEEKEKFSKISQIQNNNNSNTFLSNKLNIEDKSKSNNFILDLKNNNSINSNINKSNSNSNTISNINLKNSTENTITPKKNEFGGININSNCKNNNNIFNSLNILQSPCFANAQNESNIKLNNNNINNTPKIKYNINLVPQFSFNKTGNKVNIINNKNEITFNISSNKKIELSSSKKNNNMNNLLNTPTLNINNINNNTSSNNSNNLIENKKNYVQDVILLSTNKKSINNNNNYQIKYKTIQKYENDFEEYEMSDSSRNNDEEEEEDEDNSKFVPKWALDDEYISMQLMKQNKNKDLIIKSFGNFVVERLNLNMIFETHNELFDIRNSTADWREEDSWAKNNKITDVNDIDGNDIFPNRKLQFV